MPTPCRWGATPSLDVRLDAPWHEVLAAILRQSNGSGARAVMSQVTEDTFNAARGIVPPQIAIECIRTLSKQLGYCATYGVGRGGQSGLAMINNGFAQTFGGTGGVDPTDPWSALVVVLSELRRIAETRLTAYGRLWTDTLLGSRSALFDDLAGRVAPLYEYGGGIGEAYEVTTAAREMDWRSTVQPHGWRELKNGGLNYYGEKIAWPDALAYDIEFWGLVVMEMLVVQATGDRALAGKLWKGLLNEGNNGLVGYYGGGLTQPFISLIHDGIVWVRPLVSYAVDLVRNYSGLPSGQRRAMDLSGNELNVLDSALVTVIGILGRIGPMDGAVGPYNVGTIPRLGWNQPGVVTSYVNNTQAVPIQALYSTLLPFDDEVAYFLGYSGVPAPPGPPPPEPPEPTPPGPGTPPGGPTVQRSSPVAPLLVGLGVPLAIYFLWTAWRKS